MFLRTALARAAQGRRDRSARAGKFCTRRCSSRCRACWCSRSPSSRKGAPVEDAAAGILWIAIAFSGTLALGRTFERERYGETLRALLLAPAPRPAIYVGKLLGMLALLGARRAAARAAGRAAVSGAAVRASRCCSPALLAGGTIGFAAVGTLFAAMLVRARSRDVMLPILLYPMTIPVMIAGVRGTAALLAPPPDEPTAMMWIGDAGVRSTWCS